jgi:signal transduction histidine kinase
MAVAIFFLIVVVLVGNWIVHSIQEAVLTKNSEYAAYYMDAFLEPNIQSLQDGRQLSPQDYAALEKISQDEGLQRHVVAIKIWLPDGTVVFSTDKSLEGKKFDPEELEGPMQGKIGAYLDDLTAEENEHERAYSGPIYEVYIPLRSRETAKIIAVGEFYENASLLKLQLYQSLVSSLVVLGGVAMVLWGVIYITVTQGMHTIVDQREEVGRLRASNEHLEGQHETLKQDVEAAQRNLNEIDRLFRRRVGLELHDGPSQLLTFVLMNLDEIAELEESAERASGRGDEKSAALRAQIVRVKQVTREALRDIRAISTTLFSLDRNEDVTPPEPLAQTVADFEARTGLSVDKSGLDLVDDLPTPIRQSLARVIVEALNNSFLHGGATKTSIAIRLDTLKGKRLFVTISDNGKGIGSQDALVNAARAGRLGLLGMRHRIEALGGIFQIDSLPDQPTVIAIELPITP